MKKKKAKKFPNFKYIWVELFGGNIYFIACSREDYEGAIKREFKRSPPRKEKGVVGTTESFYHDDEIIHVIWVNQVKDIPTLSHEVFHVVHEILKAKGLFLHDASEEAYCHLLHFILCKILDK